MIEVKPRSDIVAPFSAAPGRLIAFEVDDDGYWRSEVRALFEGNYAFKIRADSRVPVPACPYLECFTLSLERGQYHSELPRRIDPPFRIVGISLLRREEWCVPAPELTGKTAGNNPHIMMSGPPGSANPSAVAAILVTAGLLFTSDDSRQIAVLTSSQIPLNVDWVQEPELLNEVLQEHSVERVWHSA